MSRMIQWIKHSPTISQSIQAGTIMATGDFIAQKFIEKRETLDKRRILTFGTIGLVFVGPVLSTWYRFLDCALPYHWSRIRRGFTKMVIDQTVAAPIMLASVLALLEISLGTPTWEAVKIELSEKYTTILKNNYKIWPAVQFINFAFVPLPLQVATNQIVGVAWNTYLSAAKNEDTKEAAKEKKKSESGKSEPGKSEQRKSESRKSESRKSESRKSESKTDK